MLQILLKGFSLGLALGTTCLMTCTPIYLPYLISEDRKLGKGIVTVLEISAGRFFSYLAFGALAGFTGSQISAVNRELFTAIAYILLSSYLILSAVRAHRSQKKCHVPKLAKLTKSVFILGILTGINFCPAFLMALSNAVDLGGAVDGMLLFLGFFIGTSLYLFPLAFIGQLSKVDVMKKVAQLASILVAVFFIYEGTAKLIHYFGHDETASISTKEISGRIVEAFHPKIPLLVVSTEENFDYFSVVRDSAEVYHPLQVEAFVYQESIFDTLNSNNKVLIIDGDMMKNKTAARQLDGFDYFYVEPDYPVSNLMHFLGLYSFKTSNNMHFEFKRN